MSLLVHGLLVAALIGAAFGVLTPQDASNNMFVRIPTGGVSMYVDRVFDQFKLNNQIYENYTVVYESELKTVPVGCGAIVALFNHPDVDSLTLSQEVLAKIWRGDIRFWDDPEIEDLNPDVVLASENITVFQVIDESMLLLQSKQLPNPNSTRPDETYFIEKAFSEDAVFSCLGTEYSLTLVHSDTAIALGATNIANLKNNAGQTVAYHWSSASLILDESLVDAYFNTYDTWTNTIANAWPLAHPIYFLFRADQHSSCGSRLPQLRMLLGGVSTMLMDPNVRNFAGEVGFAPSPFTISPFNNRWLEEVLCNDETVGADVSIIVEMYGGTFPVALYRTLAFMYSTLHPDITIKYTAIGSGNSQKKMMARNVSLIGSDADYKSADYAREGQDNIQMFPTVASAVVVIANVPSVPSDYRFLFNRTTLGGIFSGRIAKWNHAEIQADNPTIGHLLPDVNITQTSQCGKRGTNLIFTSSLVEMDPDGFGSEVVASATMDWPKAHTGELVCCRGNDGVASTLQATPNSIGFVVWDFAVHYHPYRTS